MKRVGGRRQTCTSVLKWPSEAIVLLSAPLCFLWVRVEEWKGAQGRKKASFRNAFHLHFYNKTSKFWLIIRASLSTKSRMIKAHISNACEAEVKSFSLTDGGMFILQRFTPSPQIRKELLGALYLYWKHMCAGRVSKSEERRCNLISNCVFNKRPSNQKHRRTCEGKVPIRVNR